MPTIEESGISQHLLIPSTSGRVLSDVTGKVLQYGAVCNPSLYPLPTRESRNSHSFTDEPRATTCAACKATPEYAAAFKERTGNDYTPSMKDSTNGN